jgi:transcriptional regulator with XRE-family HTH domain
VSTEGSTFAELLGPKIRRAREASGMSQAQVADRAGVGQSTVARYERGVLAPRLEPFVKVAIALGVSPCALLPGLEWDPKATVQKTPL